MRHVLRVVCTLAFLAASIAHGAFAADAPPGAITDADLRDVTRAIYQSATAGAAVMPSPADAMQCNVPPAYANAHAKNVFDGCFFAAYAMAAIVAGYGGTGWQVRIAAAPDHETLRAQIASAFTARNERTVVQSRADIAWVHANLHPGMTRDAAYDALRTRRLLAYNEAYNPGTPTALGGCDGDATRAQAAWPRAGEKYPNGCALHPPGDAPPNPTAFIRYRLNANLACSTEVLQELAFDASDLLKAVTDDPERSVCL